MTYFNLWRQCIIDLFITLGTEVMTSDLCVYRNHCMVTSLLQHIKFSVRFSESNCMHEKCCCGLNSWWILLIWNSVPTQKHFGGFCEDSKSKWLTVEVSIIYLNSWYWCKELLFVRERVVWHVCLPVHSHGLNRWTSPSWLQGLSCPHQAASYFFLKI